MTREGYAWRAAAELVGFTTTQSAEAMFALLTRDLTGRLLLLSPAYTDCGISEADLVDGKHYWCIDLAAR